jgi:hypothetical protein
LQVAFAHPKQACFETIGFNRRVVFVRNDVAALDENLLGERDADALASGGVVARRGVPTLDAGDDAGFCIGRKNERVADAQRAAFYATGDHAALVETIHVLDGEAHREFGERFRRLEGVEHVEHGRAGIPVHRVLHGRDIVACRVVRERREIHRFECDIRAVARGDRHERARLDADLREESFVFRNDFFKDLVRVIHEIHLVHRDDDLVNAEQAQQIPVPARLLAHAFIRRDEQHRRIRAGRAGDHVFQKLLVPRRINDDVRPLGRLELNLRGINGDILLLLLEQRIEQKGVFKLHPLLAAGLLDLLHLSFRQRFCVVENATDEGGFPVIHMADENDFETIRARRSDCESRNSLAIAFQGLGMRWRKISGSGHDDFGKILVLDNSLSVVSPAMACRKQTRHLNKF